jgi:hypothetical protein
MPSLVYMTEITVAILITRNSLLVYSIREVPSPKPLPDLRLRSLLRALRN